jgi:hypothetical protein
MSKSPAIEQFLDAFSVKYLGRARKKCIEEGICVGCGREASTFLDGVSQTEYRITGLCQVCQEIKIPEEEE